jgi:hypothetical protein
MSQQGKDKSYSLMSRLVAMTACVALLVVGVTWWLAGFSLFVGIATAVALAGLFGPVVVESGGGIVEMLSGLLELIGEALSSLFEAICSIFSGFG